MNRFASLPLLGALLALPIAAQDFQPRMGEPLSGLTQEQLTRFEAGKAEYLAVLSEADGLGPIFNDSGCAQCHSTPAVGGFSTRNVTRFAKAANGGQPFDPLADLGGSLLQSTGLSSLPTVLWEQIPAEADVIIGRNTPHVFGAGLVEAIEDADFVANELDPRDNGIVKWVAPLEGGAPRPGRFGWKADVPTVLHFSADASLNELGLTNRFLTEENAPNGNQATLDTYDTVADPEDSTVPGTGRIDRQTDFQRLLAPPPQTPKTGMAGEAIFTSIGCATCHHPSYTTGSSPEAGLSGVEIRPYSDFLLHDMGSLGDGIVSGTATERLMMTRPLWGISLRQSFLHDGRATGSTFVGNLDSTIQFHDGEAASSRNAFNGLTQAEQDALFAFLGSLGRAEFDLEHNNRVDFFDWALLEPNFTGPAPAQPLTPDDDGAIGDIDQDADFDLRDFLIFQRAYTG